MTVNVKLNFREVITLHHIANSELLRNSPCRVFCFAANEPWPGTSIPINFGTNCPLAHCNNCAFATELLKSDLNFNEAFLKIQEVFNTSYTERCKILYWDRKDENDQLTITHPEI